MVLMRSERFEYGKLVIDDAGNWKFMVITDIINDIPKIDWIKKGDGEDFNAGVSLYLLNKLGDKGWIYHHHQELEEFSKTYLFVKRKL